MPISKGPLTQNTDTHLAVLNAWRLHRHSRQPLLDGMDFSPRHLYLESTRRKRLIRLRHSVHLHHKVRLADLSCPRSVDHTESTDQASSTSSYQYIIDSYEVYAASALASATMIRYVASGGMVIVATPFYKNMGVPYTLTIMACLSACMAPVPFVFYKYGPWIRSKSRHAIKS
jgi:hypothetical protein